MNTSIYHISLLDLLWVMIPVAMVIPIKCTFKQLCFLNDFIIYRCILAIEYEFLANLNTSSIIDQIGLSSIQFCIKDQH